MEDKELLQIYDENILLFYKELGVKSPISNINQKAHLNALRKVISSYIDRLCEKGYYKSCIAVPTTVNPEDLFNKYDYYYDCYLTDVGEKKVSVITEIRYFFDVCLNNPIGLKEVLEMIDNQKNIKGPELILQKVDLIIAEELRSRLFNVGATIKIIRGGLK